MQVYVSPFISMSTFFLVFNQDFITYIDFTHIALSNTITNDVTNQVTRRIFNTNLKYTLLVIILHSW